MEPQSEMKIAKKKLGETKFLEGFCKCCQPQIIIIVSTFYIAHVWSSCRIKSSVGLTDKIPVGVGLHQGSSLSPYLFAMIMDVLAHGIKDLSPWCMLYADDIVLCGTRREVVENKLEEWRRAMEDRGLKININKTVYLRFNVDGNLDGKLRYQSTGTAFGTSKYF